ncbi:MAG TPA: HAMP domain-containing sensor histidine kinase [Candidatus Limnocylindrales bacterium]|nr:HAMP domain-containing sensor histidine kinase [Candidatus Limnocylindrales bacterium]
MKRLYLQIYLAFVGAVALFALGSALVWALVPRDFEAMQMLDGVAWLVEKTLPPASAPQIEQHAALVRLAEKFPAFLTMRSADSELIANVGPALPPPPPQKASLLRMEGRTGASKCRLFHADHGLVAALAMSDGRWILARHHHHRGPRPLGALAMLAGLAAAIAVAAYPVVRRLTRRLERLNASVTALGGGDLSARVTVEGRDEVAALAHSFNAAAERIERLVRSLKEALASASHELRSPLARMRMALALLPADTRQDVRDRIDRDIRELDDLVGEILLTSRLDAGAVAAAREPVDLLALVAEEAALVDAEVAGDAVTVHGDVRLLRRLVRNLLENARRYGAGSPVQARVARADGGGAVLSVSDRGPGIPEAERERIFEPFYRRAGTHEGEGGGVGLGLSLVRQIAELHGGRAVALARSGGGTTIEVLLR